VRQAPLRAGCPVPRLAVVEQGPDGDQGRGRQQGSQQLAGGLSIKAKACSTARSTAAGSWPAQRNCQYSPALLYCSCTEAVTALLQWCQGLFQHTL
jgi:hypothetical protein